MTRDELSAWLRLVETPGVGNDAARRLLAAFGSPERVFDASEAVRREVCGPDLARDLGTLPSTHAERVAATWTWLEQAAEGAPRHVLVLGDPAYPALLLQTADPPLLLYAIGRVHLLSAPSIAVVGSRRASPQGLENARDLAQQLSDRGFAIVSGLALGIDGAAHEGGLAGRGSTLALVGTGLDLVYPPGHAALARRIEREGVIASEYALGMPPLAANFPRRNRLIAGMSQGTLVVEAALKSGSLVTARLAVEAGREVFAIPGSIHSPLTRGCHRLIQQGAKLVETIEDILQELAPPRAATRPDDPPRAAGAGRRNASAEDDPDAALLAALGHDPVTFDALGARTGQPSEVLAARLLELELAGRVHRLPGGLWQRRGRA
jgi:DNA processing protein